MKVEQYRISGTEAEIDALIMAARMDGCWEPLTKAGHIRIMMRSIVSDDSGFTSLLSPQWTRLHALALKMRGSDGE